MTKREKRLLWVVVGGVSVFAFIGGGNRWFIEPFRDADERTHSLQETLLAHENEFIEAKRAQNSLRGLAQRTFGVDPEETSARIGEYLTDAITAVGLDDRKFSRVPVGQRVLGRSRVRGAINPIEIGWSVQGAGPLEKIIDLIAKLESDVRLHRIENLSVQPGGDVATRRISFRYLALLFGPMSGVTLVTEEAALVPNVERRKQLAAITRRALFRPYVKRPPPPPPPPPPPKKADPPPPSGPETYRLVSLSEWKGRSEVVVLDTNKGLTTKYRTGDELAGGKVVAVDYRTLPRPKNPDLESSSRVIISADNALWAIESGDTLADKYELSADRLPPDLRKD